MSGDTELVHAHAELPGVRLHYVTAGAGEPLVLLHGWPQTWFEWRGVIERLADRYTLVAPDLRGLGDSARPAEGYDTATLAGDVLALVVDHLGHDRFLLAGHDWGGPVAYAVAARAPERVRALAVVDVTIPGDGRAAGTSQGGRRWHHAFHMTPDLPEALIAGREDVYLGWFYDTFGARADAIDADTRTEYLRTYRQPGALAAGLAYYRNIALDAEQNAASIARGKLSMPVLAVGGGASWGRGAEVEASCRQLAENVQGLVVPGAGHWLPEEQPGALADALRAFFSGA